MCSNPAERSMMFSDEEELGEEVDVREDDEVDENAEEYEERSNTIQNKLKVFSIDSQSFFKFVVSPVSATIGPKYFLMCAISILNLRIFPCFTSTQFLNNAMHN